MGIAEILIAVVPVIVLLGFIYIKDVDKEPRKLLFKLFVFGAISVIPILIVELLVDEMIPTSYIPNFFIFFISVFLGVALVEEFAKWFVAYVFGYKSKDFNHRYDGIVYAVFVSLGFAIVENVLYVNKFGFDVGLARAKFSIPGHTVFAVFMGYFLSLSKSEALKGNKKSLWYLILSVLVPTLIHTFYDTIILYVEANPSMDYLENVFYIFVMISYSTALGLVNKTSLVKYNFDNTPISSPPVNNSNVINNPVTTNSKCYYCGAPLTTNICTNCGKHQDYR